MADDGQLHGKEKKYLERLKRRAEWLAQRSGARGHNPHGDHDIAELHAIEWAIELIEQVYGLPHTPYLSARGRSLKEFFNTAMHVSFDGDDWGGDDIQTKAVELGLARREPFDPGKHGEHDTIEPGGEWLVITC